MSFKKLYFESEEFEIDPMQVWIDMDLDDVPDESIDKDRDGILDIEDDSVDISQPVDDLEDVGEKESPIIRRKLARVKRETINKATKGEFFNWNLRKRAEFLSKWEFKAMPGFKGRMIKRTPIVNPNVLMKKMKAASKRMKRRKDISKRGRITSKRLGTMGQ